MSRVERPPGEAGGTAEPPTKRAAPRRSAGFRTALEGERRRRMGKGGAPHGAQVAQAPTSEPEAPRPQSTGSTAPAATPATSAAGQRRSLSLEAAFADITSALQAAAELASADGANTDAPPSAGGIALAEGTGTGGPSAVLGAYPRAHARVPEPGSDGDFDPITDPWFEHEVTAPHGRPGSSGDAPDLGHLAPGPDALEGLPPAPALSPPTPPPTGPGARAAAAGTDAAAAAPAVLLPPADDDALRRAHLGAQRAELVVGEGDERISLRVIADAHHVRVEAAAASPALAQALTAGTGELRAELARHGLALAAFIAESGDTPTGGGERGPSSDPEPEPPGIDDRTPTNGAEGARLGVRAVA
jgi:hypothetical protein